MHSTTPNETSGRPCRTRARVRRFATEILALAAILAPAAVLAPAAILALAPAARAAAVQSPSEEPVVTDPADAPPIGALLDDRFAGRTWIVGTKQAAPFSFRTDDGPWRGISIELWKRIAERLGIEYELREMSLEDLVRGLAAGEHDASVAALTVTPDREALLDFSHAFYPSGLGIAVPSEGGSSTLGALRGLLSVRFFQAVATLAVFILLAGAALWIFERRKNAEQFGGTVRQGLGSAFWWSAVTMTTVGYGDKAPTTAGGRTIALVWMFASIITISGLTAAIASTLTLSGLQTSLSGPDDLRSTDRIACVAGSTGEDWLREQRLPYASRETTRAAMQALADGEFDALVYDAPILRYLAGEEFSGTVSVLPVVFERQDYAIGLTLDSPVRKAVNRALLEIISDDSWGDVLYEYLGTSR